MRYAVFGVGRQGAAVIYDLFERCGATAVVAFDVDPRVSERLGEVLGPRAAAVELHRESPDDAAAAGRIIERVRGCACVISALPYALNPALTRLCVRAGVAMCDLGGNPDVIAEQKALCDGSTLVMPDCGLAPGLNNLMTVSLRGSAGIVSARSYCGGIPAQQTPDNPLQYKLLFSPWGLISEYSGRCAVLRDGRVEFVEALTGHEELPDGREAFYTSNNSPLTYEYLREIGLREYEYKTVRWRGHLEKVLLLKRLGFFRGNRAADQALADAMQQQDWLRYDRRRDVDEVFLRVEGKSADGRTAALGIVVHGTPMFSAMELTTSWGITIPALWLARGAAERRAVLPTGCLPPERVVDGAWALGELARRTPVRREGLAD